MTDPAEDLLARWPAALGLVERAALQNGKATDPVAASIWRETGHLADESIWRSFLETLGITEDAFQAALVAPGSRELEAPPWVKLALDAAAFGAGGASGAAAVVAPWVTRSRRTLKDALRLLSSDRSPIFDLKIAYTLGHSLYEDLLELAVRPVLLEAAIAEHQGGAAAHTEFLRGLSRAEERSRLFGLYPGLALEMSLASERWLAASVQSANQLAEDWHLIVDRFGINADDPVSSFRFAASDPHDGGRRVLIIAFGSGRRLVLKPRSLKVFAGFQGLLRLMNANGFIPSFKPLAVLDCGDRGWVEYSRAADCATVAAVDRFYRRLGGQLALLRLVGASDCHCENLIAAGEDPHLIDIETLLAPGPARLSARANADALAQAEVTESVLRTGLLPAPTRVHAQPADLSGIGGRSHQPTPLPAFQVNTDADGLLRVFHSPWVLPRLTNRPRLNGRECDPRRHHEAIGAGFRQASEILRSHRDQVSNRLNAMAGDEVRVVLRPTTVYATILRESRHPSALHDGSDRDRALAALWDNAPHPSALGSEFAQLQAGDIPFFRGRTDGVDVHYRLDSAPLMTWERSGLAAALERLQRHDLVDIERQERLIATSIAALGGRLLSQGARSALTPQSPLALARRLGERLSVEALVSGGEAIWLAPRAYDDPPCPRLGEAPVQIIPTDLYSGLAGVIVFLVRLNRASGEERFGILASQAGRALERRISEGELSGESGAFDGLAGAAYAFGHLASSTGESTWSKAATAFSDESLALAVERPSLDMISGLAGVLCARLAVGAFTGASSDPEGCRAAAVLRDRLLREVGGLAYRRGASHGLSGAVWALALAAHRFQEPTLLPPALIDAEVNQTAGERWIDDGDPLHAGQSTWCHGASGVALCRAAGARLHQSQVLAAGARAALEAAVAADWPSEAGLCHGVAGNLDALVVGWQAGLGRQSAALTQGRRLLRSHATKLAEAPGLSNPSLMTGVAGVGLQLLRLSDSATPSILLLEAA